MTMLVVCLTFYFPFNQPVNQSITRADAIYLNMFLVSSMPTRLTSCIPFLAVLEVHVELLIRAHDCFTLSCNMEGISEVLHAARLCNVQLTRSKSYSLMVCYVFPCSFFNLLRYYSLVYWWCGLQISHQTY